MRATGARLLQLKLYTKEQLTKPALASASKTMADVQAVNKAINTASQETVMDRLTDTMAAEKSAGVWPENLRIERAEKKTMFWKVPKEKRTELKRLLREA